MTAPEDGLLIRPSDRIFVAGHRGMAGSAICRALQRKGYGHILTATRQELDLEDGGAVRAWFEANRPEVVVLAAAKVGGIHANDTYPADFLLQNLKIQNNVIESAWRSGTRRLMFLGSSCIYPRECAQPIKEEYLLTGPLEPTNEWYAIAKIAGIKLCQALRIQPRLRCDQPDAHQSVWAGRQLPPRKQPCDGSDDPPLSRSKYVWYH